MFKISLKTLFFVFVAGTVSGQNIDSLRPYTLPIWKARLIARDLATLDRQTILLDSAGKVIALKNDALKLAVLHSQALDSAYTAKDNESKACRSLVGVNEQIYKEELKSELNKGRKQGATGIGIIAVILIVLVL